MNASLSELVSLLDLHFLVFSLSKSNLTDLYQVLISKTYVLLYTFQFWDSLQAELAYKIPYKDSISAMHPRL